MERRFLLAALLSMVVLFGFQALFGPPPPTPDTANNATPPVLTPPATGVASGPAAATPAPQAPQVSESIVGDTEERDVVVETPLVRAVFSNRGGRLVHWVLKAYRDDRGEALDLVPAAVPADLPRPFSLRVADAATTVRINQTLYRVTQPDRSGGPPVLEFDLESADGLKVKKTFAFEPEGYVVAFSARVELNGAAEVPVVEWGPGLGDDVARSHPGSFFSPNYLYKAQAIYHTDGAVEREAASSLGPGVVRQGQFRWAGVDDHYFISAVLQPPAPVRLEFQPVVFPPRSAEEAPGEHVMYAVQFPAPPDGARFYIGPKQLDVMRAIDPEFTRAIYFGMFAFLAAPLLEGLKWVYGFIGNWGWSIVVLTILINLVMFPLRHWSVVSMRRMQEVQPQMKAIQERYAKYKITDPERQKMNTEVMELYRAKGVNPAGGCLPMLLTMPFLFAFYAMLGQAIEIRGQDFLGWIPDLSRSDPFYITPLLMGVTMFWQMRIQPTTADPTQQKVMMMMPFMITITMLFAPAGLVIYWFVSNLWAIGQQYFTNWLIGPPKVPGVRPPKEPRPKDIEAKKVPERAK